MPQQSTRPNRLDGALGRSYCKSYLVELASRGETGTHYLLPNPKQVSSGSGTDLSNFPSFMNRSGLNLKGSGYTVSLWSMALYYRNIRHSRFIVDFEKTLYHEFPITIEPLGRWYPRYTSSASRRWGIAVGSASECLQTYQVCVRTDWGDISPP